MNATAHPAYKDGVANAVNRARRSPGESFTVYYDGEAIWVLASPAMKPKNSKAICIAHRWDAHTIQLRFPEDGRTEFLNV